MGPILQMDSDLGQTVNPISTKGADYAHHRTTSPEFLNLATALPELNVTEMIGRFQIKTQYSKD